MTAPTFTEAEQTARDTRWAMLNWPADGPKRNRVTFDEGWSAHLDYVARCRRVRIRRGLPPEEQEGEQPPTESKEATVGWYFARNKGDGDTDTFLRGWDAAEQWMRQRLLDAARASRRSFQTAARMLIDAVAATELVAQYGVSLDGMCVACGNGPDDLHSIGGELACIDCIEERLKSAEQDLAALQKFLAPAPGESLLQACQRRCTAPPTADQFNLWLSVLRQRVKCAYERGVLQVIDELSKRPNEALGAVMDVFHVKATGRGFTIDPDLPFTKQCVADIGRNMEEDAP
jgi:hypothetical protein